MKNKNRDNLFDNYKGILIILVVLAHFMEPFRKQSEVIKALVIVIYSFHMPAFVFCAAYFSRHNRLLILVKKIFIPYVVFQILYYFLWNYIFHEESYFEILRPKFSLWFLLSLFCWRLLIDKIKLIKGILPISFLLGVLIGFDVSVSGLGSVGRTIGFLPFFILGYQFNREKFIGYFNNKMVRGGLVLVLVFMGVLLFCQYEQVDYQILTMKNSYKLIKLPDWGWLYRTYFYMWATLVIYMLAAVIPRNRHWISTLGQRSLSIYLLHGIVYKYLQHRTNFFERMDTDLEMVLTLVFAVALTFVLSRKPFHYCITKLTSIPIEKLLKE